MERISIREAAKRFDVSRPTLTKRLEKGEISGERQAGGGWLIDPAELIRAGYKGRQTVDKLPGKGVVKLTGFAPPVAGGGKIPLPPSAKGLPGGADPAEAELAALRAELAEAQKRAAVAEALAEERAQRIEDLRRMLPAPDAPRRRWWPWSF